LLAPFTLTAGAAPSFLEQLGLSDDTPPLVEEAFQVSVDVTDDKTLTTHWAVMEGNYLYKDKLAVSIVNHPNVGVTNYQLPTGKQKDDPLFGLTEVYLNDFAADIGITRPSAATEFQLKIDYQGCSETFGICYPPAEVIVDIALPAQSIATTPQSDSNTALALTEQDRIAEKLATDKLWQIILGFLGLGLLLAFTPCVFPMIPILSSIIVGQGDHITPRKAFMLSLVYVLSMSVTYTAAGVLTGLLGQNLQALFQTPWILYSFSGVFVVLALSMFGLFELQLPHALQHRIHQLSHSQQGGKWIGVAIMGLLSGVIVGPCLAPPLAGTLIFIGQSADPVLGGIALFSLSMGMGFPLLLLGTSAGTLLPKAGNWMVTIKSIFGVLLLGLAIWMLERVIPAPATLLLWGTLLIVTAVYMGAFNRLQIDDNGWTKLYKGVGLVLFIYGGALVIGGASGQTNLLQPLQFTANSSSPSNQQLNFDYVDNLEELHIYLANSGKPVFVDFYADWCTDCKTMEATTFKDPAVLAELKNYNVVKVDVTDNTETHQVLMKNLKVFGPPTMLFFDAQGEEHRSYRQVGHIDGPRLASILEQLSQS
jgi:thiol:disulfide interchange protein DsbD